MTILPIIIASLVMLIAIVLYHGMPKVIDLAEPSFLWVAGGFVALWIIAAAYMYYAIPGASAYHP